MWSMPTAELGYIRLADNLLKQGLAAATDAGLDVEAVYLVRSSRKNFRCQQALKRVVDVILAGLGLVLISPLLLLIALSIKLTSPGPVFYVSERIGKDYRPFGMIKFRTMTVDADSRRDALREEANLQGELFKLKNDPRVTPIGRMLRACSLDELPQLFNVLRGDMSLVGPRPLPPDESRLFEEPFTLRFQVYPGVTGAWQVNGRSNSSFHQLCRLEMNYLLGWNLWSDVRIMLQTVPAVLCSRGAY